MPGRRNCRYSPVEPAKAPPNRKVNISVNMIGNAVTSKSCSGTCLIFSSARHPNVSDADSALGRGGLARTDSAERIASSRTGGAEVVGVVMRHPPR
jgi:hypothetical protein